MSNPDNVPDHVREALRVYDRAVEEAWKRVRGSSSPWFGGTLYREILVEHRKLGDAAERLCEEIFGYNLLPYDDRTMRDLYGSSTADGISWVSHALGRRRVAIPKTREERVALAIDLWLARNRGQSLRSEP